MLDTEGLPLPKDQLKVYAEVGSVDTSKGESSAAGPVIIEIPNDPSGGDSDLSKALRNYLLKSYPKATVDILSQDDVDLNLINEKIFIMMRESPIVSVSTDAPAAHVVIAAGAAFWLAGQGLDVQDMTNNQLIESDLQFS